MLDVNLFAWGVIIVLVLTHKVLWALDRGEDHWSFHYFWASLIGKRWWELIVDISWRAKFIFVLPVGWWAMIVGYFPLDWYLKIDRYHLRLKFIWLNSISSHFIQPKWQRFNEFDTKNTAPSVVSRYLENKKMIIIFFGIRKR